MHCIGRRKEKEGEGLLIVAASCFVHVAHYILLVYMRDLKENRIEPSTAVRNPVKKFPKISQY